MPPDHDLDYAISLSLIPLVMNVIFLILSLVIYKNLIQNRKFNAIQILPDFLEGDHKTVFFGKIDLINKKIKSHFILIAIINTILILLIFGYSFVLAPLFDKSISEEQKYDIFADLILLSIKTPPILFILYGLKVPHSPIIRPAWIALFENENIDTSCFKKSKNPFSKIYWKDRYFSDLLHIYARTFIRDNYPEKKNYLLKSSKSKVKFYNFIYKDKNQPYRRLSSFLQFTQNRLIHTLYVSELKIIKIKPKRKYYLYPIFGTILAGGGLVAILYAVETDPFHIPILSTLIFIISGMILILYGDYKLNYLNYKSMHAILSQHNIDEFNHICDEIIQLIDKEFPYVQLTASTINS